MLQSTSDPEGPLDARTQAVDLRWQKLQSTSDPEGPLDAWVRVMLHPHPGCNPRAIPKDRSTALGAGHGLTCIRLQSTSDPEGPLDHLAADELRHQRVAIHERSRRTARPRVPVDSRGRSRCNPRAIPKDRSTVDNRRIAVPTQQLQSTSDPEGPLDLSRRAMPWPATCCNPRAIPKDRSTSAAQSYALRGRCNPRAIPKDRSTLGSGHCRSASYCCNPRAIPKDRSTDRPYRLDGVSPALQSTSDPEGPLDTVARCASGHPLRVAIHERSRRTARRSLTPMSRRSEPLQSTSDPEGPLDALGAHCTVAADRSCNPRAIPKDRSTTDAAIRGDQSCCNPRAIPKDRSTMTRVRRSSVWRSCNPRAIPKDRSTMAVDWNIPIDDELQSTSDPEGPLDSSPRSARYAGPCCNPRAIPKDRSTCSSRMTSAASTCCNPRAIPKDRSTPPPKIGGKTNACHLLCADPIRHSHFQGQATRYHP